MDLRISGGRALAGTVRVNTAKNSAVALLSASLANRGQTTLRRLPRIEEVKRIIEVLQSIGVSVKWLNATDVEITPPVKLNLKNLNREAAMKTRSIVLLLGSLAHRETEFTLPHPGGCRLGARSVRPHLLALAPLGVKIVSRHDDYAVTVRPVSSRTKGESRQIILSEAGDTVTENALLAAARLPGQTTIKFASANYMVQELCHFLTTLGLEIAGLGTSTLVVRGGGEQNREVEYSLAEDPIEAMLFLALAATTGSALTIERAPIDFLELELLKLGQMGFKYQITRRYLSQNGRTNLVDIVTRPAALRAAPEKIHPLPYPGLNIDNLPFFVPIATQARGTTLIHDWVYEDRAIYYLEMNKLGAELVLADPHRVLVKGPTPLSGAEVICPPALRPAAIILIGMLAARGPSLLRNVYSINRGYEDLATRLQKLGAKIEVVN